MRDIPGLDNLLYMQAECLAASQKDWASGFVVGLCVYVFADLVWLTVKTVYFYAKGKQ